MILTSSDQARLVSILQRLSLSPDLAGQYAVGFSNPFSAAFRAAELKIAEALAKIPPKRFGWTNAPGVMGSLLVEAGTGVIVEGANRQPIARMQKVIHNAKGRVIFERARGFILDNERPIRFMYLDTAGKVTVGVGHLVPNVENAKELGFVVRKSEVAATPAQIAEAYGLVKAVGSGAGGTNAFLKTTNLILRPSAIDSLFEQDFLIHRDSIPSEFPLATYPVPAQIGFVDLIFQIGATKFGRDSAYPKFKAALKRRDWLRAGCEADVNKPPTPNRNERRKQEFAKAAREEPFFTTDPRRSKPLLQFLLKL